MMLIVKKHKYLVYVLLLSVVIFLFNTIWVLLDSRPPHWDMGRHLWTSIQYSNLLNKGEILPLLQSYFYYPPLLYWLTGIFYIFFGNSINTAVSVNLIFIFIFSFSSYSIARRFFEEKLSLLATLIASSYPIVITQFKEYQLDAPLMAFCALFLALIIRRPFRNYYQSVILGAIIGAGMLLKWTFIIFIFFPIILVIVEYFVETKNTTQDRLIYLFKHLSLMFLIAYLIASPWYVANIQQIRIDFRQNGVAQALIEGDPRVGSLSSNFWYFKNLFINQLHLLWGAIFIVGLINVLRSKRLITKYRFPLVYILGSILILTFLPNKDARYSMAILPAVAVISLSWIPLIKGATYKNVTMLSIAIFSLLTWVNVSFGVPGLKSFSLWGYPVMKDEGYIIGNPSKEQWYQEEVAEIASKTKNKSIEYRTKDTIWFNNWTWSYLTSRYNLNNTSGGADIIADRSIVSPTDTPNGYNIIRSYSLPDGSYLNVYEKAK